MRCEAKIHADPCPTLPGRTPEPLHSWRVYPDSHRAQAMVCAPIQQENGAMNSMILLLRILYVDAESTPSQSPGSRFWLACRDLHSDQVDQDYVRQQDS